MQEELGPTSGEAKERIWGQQHSNWFEINEVDVFNLANAIKNKRKEGVGSGSGFKNNQTTEMCLVSWSSVGLVFILLPVLGSLV